MSVTKAPGYIEAPQKEMPFAAEIETALRPYAIGQLHDMRAQIAADLARESKGMAATCLVIAACVPQSARVFGEALAQFPRKPAVRRKLRTFRTLCLYTAQRERQAAPHAQPVSVLPPPPNPPAETPQPELFSDPMTTTQKQH